MLVEGLGIRFLITTRTRPDWFTPRLEVYGEGLEIGVDDLAMTDEEAARVLTAVGAVAGRARLMRTAEGWPAVLGLAAMSGDVDFTLEPPAVAHALRLPRERAARRRGGRDAGRADVACGRVGHGRRGGALQFSARDADGVMEDAVTRGLVAVTDHKSLSLHPLLRELLIRRFEDADDETREACSRRARKLFELRRWDEALCVAEVAKNAAFATEAIGSGVGRPPCRWPHEQPAALGRGRTVSGSRRRPHRLRRERGAAPSDELDRAMALATQAAESGSTETWLRAPTSSPAKQHT